MTHVLDHWVVEQAIFHARACSDLRVHYLSMWLERALQQIQYNRFFEVIIRSMLGILEMRHDLLGNILEQTTANQYS